MRSLGLSLTLVLAAVLACDRPPSAADLREWTPQDHDRANDQSRTASGDQPGSASAADEGRMLVEAAWRQQCAPCHGMTGKGDGPTGPMVKAPDLTRDEWQSKTNDEEIAAVIKNGKGRMPKFEMEDAMVMGLV